MRWQLLQQDNSPEHTASVGVLLELSHHVSCGHISVYVPPYTHVHRLSGFASN